MDVITFMIRLGEFTSWPIAMIIARLVLKKPNEGLLSHLNETGHIECFQIFLLLGNSYLILCHI